MSSPPLRGIRVLELGSSIAGPAAGRLLGDLGAEVLKVEPPEGDPMRKWGVMSPDGTSWHFKAHNRNKRFLCFDLHKPEDRAVVRAIALRSDVVLENFRPGRLDSWGLGAGELRREKPELIYASISGFGQDGRYAQRTAYGSIAEGVGGLRYVTGYPDLPPARMAVNIGDEVAALYAVVGVVSSLFARNSDKRGDRVDVSLVESCFSLFQGALTEYAAAGKVRERVGLGHDNMAPNSVYLTRDDKWVTLAAVTEPLFRRLCIAMERRELLDDPRFGDNGTRTANRETIDTLVGDWVRAHDSAEVVETLAKAEVPCGPINSIADIVTDPYFRERDAILDLVDRDGTKVSGTGIVPRLSERPGDPGLAAGPIGADHAAVLRELEL